MDQGQIIQKKENSDPHSAGTSKEANPLQSALRIRGSAFADSTHFKEFQSGIDHFLVHYLVCSFVKSYDIRGIYLGKEETEVLRRQTSCSKLNYRLTLESVKG